MIDFDRRQPVVVRRRDRIDRLRPRDRLQLQKRVGTRRVVLTLAEAFQRAEVEEPILDDRTGDRAFSTQ